MFTEQAGSPIFGCVVTGKCLEEGYCVVWWEPCLLDGDRCRQVAWERAGKGKDGMLCCHSPEAGPGRAELTLL